MQTKDTRDISAVADGAPRVPFPEPERAVSLAYSPCPNDTFMFAGLASGRVAVSGIRFEPNLHDVETLNQQAIKGVFDVSKVSFHAYLRVRGEYRLLNSGAALGFGCGPLIVARTACDPAAVGQGVVLVPGEWTTGHLLLRLWRPAPLRVRFVSYDRIVPLLQQGAADAGVIIHESRFTCRQAGLHEIVDLGRWWEGQTGLPIPLGGIVAHRRLGDSLIGRIEQAVRTSVAQAKGSPSDVMAYVRRHAQEADDSVLDQHIRMFVNDFSLDLGEAGRSAVARLEAMARQAGVLS